MGATTVQEKSTEFNQLADAKTLEEAGKINIKDCDGKEVEFKSLYSGKPDGERQLIVFIRHFMCGFCEEYIRALARELPPKQLDTVNTTLTIIGCGDHSLITEYAKRTGCPYDIYCNSDRKLYEQLGMICKLTQPGGPPPAYLQRGYFNIVASSLLVGLGMGPAKGLKAGKISQNGGEWLFQNGSLIWCKRMRNPSDHAETSELKELLGL